MDNELLTIDEAAAILRVNKSYIFKLMKESKLTVVRDGKRFTRILKSDLTEYIQKYRKPINGGKEGK